MSLYALPVTSSDLPQLQDGIQFFTDNTQAQQQTTLINNNQGTVFSYAQTLLANNVSTSQVAMGTFAYALGKTDTVAHLDGIATSFLPPQVAFAVKQNLDGGPTVYAAQVYSLALATSFADYRTSLTNQLTNGTFITNTASLTGTNASSIQGFFNVWLAFYTANPTAAPGLTASQAAAASAYGDALGVALDRGPNDTGPGIDAARAIQNAVANALFDIAQTASSPPGTKYQEGVPITSLGQHFPFQGEGSQPGNTFALTVNIDGPVGFTSTQAGAIFNALPTTTNTLNSGDNFGTTLTAAKDQGTLNYTAIASGPNLPLATNVTMSGVAKANIDNQSGVIAGFSGNIKDLIEVNAKGAGGINVGAPGNGLNTTLQTVSLAGSQNFTAWMSADALKGTDDTLNLNLNGVNAAQGAPGVNGTIVNLQVVGGANGYETVKIASTATNNINLQTNANTTKTISVTGAGALTIQGSALNIANLHNFDGSAATGNLTAFFNGTGNVTATGGTGNDKFAFLAPVGGATTFTSASSVDGDGGKNTLGIISDTGAILGAGVGPNIKNIAVIEHFTTTNTGVTPPVLNPATGAISADMSRAGSATELDLQGNYGNQDVSVTNLSNNMLVVYSGGPLSPANTNNIDDLTLVHTAPAVGSINFTMAQTATGGNQTINTLHVAAGVTLNLTTAGNADNNVIKNVADVNVNVTAKGGTHLDFGSQASPYTFDGGIFDASGTSGGVQTWLAKDAGILLGQSQTFIGGTGNDFVHDLDVRGDLVNFVAGGNDTVEYRQADALAVATPLQTAGAFNRVIGWTTNDTIALVVGGPPGPTPNNGWDGKFLSNTQTGTPVAVGDAVSTFHYTSGVQTLDPVLSNFNYIHIDTPVTGIGLATPATDFFTAINGAGNGFEVGAIAVNGLVLGREFLMSMYDATIQSMVLFSINSAGGASRDVISDADIAGVIGTVATIAVVGMSVADYQAFGAGNLKFVAG